MGLRRIAAHLPGSIRQRLRKLKYHLQYSTGRFGSPEPEFARLPDLVHPGDWVLDLGANVGEYTLRFSELVGPTGRVIAFEPVLETAVILAELALRAKHANITVLNLAVSEAAAVLDFHIPTGGQGLPNYFQARVSKDGGRGVLALPLDSFTFPHRIALVKIDVEEHEVSVLRGMLQLIERDRPVLIIEGHEGIHPQFLAAFGYRLHPRVPGSPNILYTPPDYN